jgi:hypothetical protein
MGDTSPKLSRFTVVGRAEDRELIRTLAKRLAESGVDADRLRVEIYKCLAPPLGTKGGIWAALRRAPPALADVKFERVFARERKLDL